MTIPSSKLTWQWKSTLSNRKYIFKSWIFRCNVSLPEGIWSDQKCRPRALTGSASTFNDSAVKGGNGGRVRRSGVGLGIGGKLFISKPQLILYGRLKDRETSAFFDKHQGALGVEVVLMVSCWLQKPWSRQHSPSPDTGDQSPVAFPFHVIRLFWYNSLVNIYMVNLTFNVK